jgi:hypothetical protein
LRWWHIFDIRVNKMAAYILRAHAALPGFGVLVLGLRFLQAASRAG